MKYMIKIWPSFLTYIWAVPFIFLSFLLPRHAEAQEMMGQSCPMCGTMDWNDSG